MFLTPDGEPVKNKFRTILTNVGELPLPKLQGQHQFESKWFKQDRGAAAYTVHRNMQTLQRFFPGRIISRFSDNLWPSRSPHLTALNFYRGILKQCSP